MRENFAWNLTGNIVYAGCQWGMIVVLTKVTSTAIVGQFAVALAVTAPIFLLSQLQLRGVQATDAKDEYCFGHYLGLRLVTTLIAMAVVLVVAFCGYDKRTALIIVAVGLSKLFESVSDVFYGLMQKNERMDRIAISRMLKGPLSLTTLTLLVFLTHDLLWGVLGMAAVWGGILWAFDLRNSRTILADGDSGGTTQSIAPLFDFGRLWKLTWLALPLGLVMALLSLNSNIPRYFIERHLGMDELGVFAALSYLVVVGGLIINAMGQSVTPRLAQYFANGEIAKFKELLLRLLLIGGGLGLASVGVAYLAGDIVLRLIYSGEYAKRQDIFVWVTVAGAVAYIASFCGYGVTAARIFKIQLPIALASVCSTLVASYLLIPQWGLQGSAVSVLIGGIVIATLYAVALSTAMRKRIRDLNNT